MIQKPDNSDFVLWRRQPCSQWLLEQIAANFDHTQDWQTILTLDGLRHIQGHQEVVDFVMRETQ